MKTYVACKNFTKKKKSEAVRRESKQWRDGFVSVARAVRMRGASWPRCRLNCRMSRGDKFGKPARQFRPPGVAIVSEGSNQQTRDGQWIDEQISAQMQFEW